LYWIQDIQRSQSTIHHMVWIFVFVSLALFCFSLLVYLISLTHFHISDRDRDYYSSSYSSREKDRHRHHWCNLEELKGAHNISVMLVKSWIFISFLMCLHCLFPLKVHVWFVCNFYHPGMKYLSFCVLIVVYMFFLLFYLYFIC
jgi:hypothetical protein